jgi:hypothetical protein
MTAFTEPSSAHTVCSETANRERDTNTPVLELQRAGAPSDGHRDSIRGDGTGMSTQRDAVSADAKQKAREVAGGTHGDSDGLSPSAARRVHRHLWSQDVKRRRVGHEGAIRALVCQLKQSACHSEGREVWGRR